jgi:hypothetical protein
MVVTLYFAYGCPSVHKIVWRIGFTTLELECWLKKKTEKDKTIKEWLYAVKGVSVNANKPKATGHVGWTAACFVTAGNLLAYQKLLLVIFRHPPLDAVAIWSLDPHTPLWASNIYESVTVSNLQCRMFMEIFVFASGSYRSPIRHQYGNSVILSTEFSIKIWNKTNVAYPLQYFAS